MSEPSKAIYLWKFLGRHTQRCALLATLPPDQFFFLTLKLVGKINHHIQFLVCMWFQCPFITKLRVARICVFSGKPQSNSFLTEEKKKCLFKCHLMVCVHFNLRRGKGRARSSDFQVNIPSLPPAPPREHSETSVSHI